MMSVHVFTSVTPNYLPKARVLAESVKRFLPRSTFHLQLVDAMPVGFSLRNEPFDSVIGIGDLGLERPEQWLFKHSVVEACTGVKGFAVKRLLSRPECSSVLYLDPDIVVLAPLDNLLARLKSASILLTPHLTQPETALEAIRDNEFSVLQHGIYNLGFLAVSNSPEGRRFAEWWASRLEQFCYDDIPSGLFTDQRWADLAPAYFPDLEILRDPGYNVSTWNLTNRRVEGNLRDGFTAAGETLYFYHFSGFDSGAQRAMLDKYGADMPSLYELRDWYIAECDRLGQQECGVTPWTYDYFENGERVTPTHRKRYRERIDLQRAFPNPYCTRDINRSYYHWFEANDESCVSVTAAAPPRSELKQVAPQISGRSGHRSQEPSYRVYLSISGSEVAAAASAITRLVAKAYRSDALYVIGPQSQLERLRAHERILDGIETVCMPEQASHDEAFRLVATRSAGDWDFIFLTTAVVVPDLFDLRLAWTAERVEGVGVVSPINDQLHATALAIDHAPESVDTLDRSCYRYAQFWNPEISTFLPDCAYFNRNAIRDVLAAPGPLTFHRFGEHLVRHRWPQILADHVYTGTLHQPKNPPNCPTDEPLSSLRTQVTNHLAKPVASSTDSIHLSARRRQLHILHSWGGGLERWVADYCRADHDHDNFILKSIGTWRSFGLELHLYRRIEDTIPLKVWTLSPAIKHTGSLHFGYQAALSEIIAQYGISAIFVSSLIGHSLDALEASVPTVVICHDFYPYCPALNITFGSICRRCGEDELVRCTESNAHNRFFLNVPPSEWVDMRKQFAERVLRRNLPLIAPSPSVRKHYVELLPELRDSFQIVPHGVKGFEVVPEVGGTQNGRLRLVVLGSLAPHKGQDLLKGMATQLRTFADLYLVGCGEYGKDFADLPNVQVIPEYRRDELPGLLQSMRPHLGMLLSVVPETFSYTLQELMELGIPVLATRIGSFADYIEERVTGFLADPEPAAFLARLCELNTNRQVLTEVRTALQNRRVRRPREMVADYESLLHLPTLSARAYFAPESSGPRRARPVRAFQLMWRAADAAFTEAESERCQVTATGANQLASMLVPSRANAPVQLRLDLGDHPGFLILHRLQLSTSFDQCLWRWDSQRDTLQGQRSGVEILGGSRGCLLYLSDNDPHWILPVENHLEALRDGGRLEIEFCYPSLQEITGGASGNGRSGRAESSSQRLLQQLAETRARVADLEGSLSWRVTGPLREIWAAVLKMRSGVS
jgi:glycosyltransferase involved in cell wall biosynthesis